VVCVSAGILRESGLAFLVGVLGEFRSVGLVSGDDVVLVGSVLAFRVVGLDGACADIVDTPPAWRAACMTWSGGV